MRSLLSSALLVAMATGCSQDKSEPTAALEPPVLTIGLSMTPQDFIAANPGFPLSEPLYGALDGAPQGFDELHDLVILPGDPTAKPMILRQIGGGTIVSFSSLIDDLEPKDRSPTTKLFSAIFFPAHGNGYWRKRRTLSKAHADALRTAEVLENAGWAPIRFRYQSNYGDRHAVGVLSFDELKPLWARDDPLVPPADVAFRSADTVITCGTGFTGSDNNPDQRGEESVRDRPLIERPIFEAVCSVSRVADVYPQSIFGDQ